jgi:hypothetical protein
VKIQTSYSSLKKFVTCPRQYAAIKVHKTCVEEPGESALYGKEVHSALENYVKNGTQLPLNYARYKPVVDGLLEIPGTKYTEMEIAIDEHKNPCAFDSSDYFIRGIIDLFIIQERAAYIFDYKTGKDTYADVRQLRLLALLVFHTYSQVDKIRAGLIFLGANSFKPEEYERKDLELLWAGFKPDFVRLIYSYENNWWPENPSGLCRRFCPDLSCPHNGRGR